jgi:putative hydrolase of the HAD superfamily
MPDDPAPIIEAVLWDYGGVFSPSPFTAARAYAASQGADPDAFVQIVFGPYDTDTDHVWHCLERGEVAILDAFAQISADAETAGMRFDAGEMFGSMGDDGIDRSIVIDVVRTIRAKGIRTAILTNNVKEYGEVWRTRLGAAEHFDHVIDSCEEGVRKPDPVIFQRALARLGVSAPERAVFLDDFEANVIAAREVGMHGIVVGHDPRPALEELVALIG